MNSLVYDIYEFLQHKSITARKDDVDNSGGKRLTVMYAHKKIF